MAIWINRPNSGAHQQQAPNRVRLTLTLPECFCYLRCLVPVRRLSIKLAFHQSQNQTADDQRKNLNSPGNGSCGRRATNQSPPAAATRAPRQPDHKLICNIPYKARQTFCTILLINGSFSVAHASAPYAMPKLSRPTAMPPTICQVMPPAAPVYDMNRQG